MLSSSSTEKRTTVRSEKAVRLARAALQAAYLVSEHLGAGLAERLFTTPRRFDRPARERALLATGRPFTVEVALQAPRWGGKPVRLAAWRWGVGPAVLLVHGWEGRGAQLGAFVEPLVESGLSVVAFDAPAHGDSPGHRAYLTDFADAIAGVADAIGPLHATIAHSFGAAAVLLAHRRHGVDAARNAMLAPNVLLEDSLRRFARFVGLDETDRIGLEHAIGASAGLPLEAMRLERVAADREDGLFVVHDREDAEVPLAHGEALAAAWPAARLRVTAGLGHRRILRDPAVVAEVVEAVRHGAPAPVSDLVREVDRVLAAGEAP
jgi:hypothetical protein